MLMGMGGARCQSRRDGMRDPASASARQCVPRLPRSGAAGAFAGFCGRGALWTVLPEW